VASPGAATAVASLSAVLPAYNEAVAITETLAGLRAVLARLGVPFEIVVVDDGSADETGALAARTPAVRVIRHTRNLGYGAALRSGFAAARHDWVFLMDADGQFDPEELPRFIEAAGHADFVVGFRDARADPGHRALFAGIWAALMAVLLGVRVRDVDCAFKLMRRSYLTAIPLEAGGAFLSAELLAKAARAGARILELPVRHLPRRGGRSTGGSPRVLVRAFYELGRLYGRVRRYRPPTVS
jgi:glycosyltransferase involved in cell wall biosynthesis